MHRTAYKTAISIVVALTSVTACGAGDERAAISVGSETIVGDAPAIPATLNRP